jgi:HEAT repeat protein
LLCVALVVFVGGGCGIGGHGGGQGGKLPRRVMQPPKPPPAVPPVVQTPIDEQLQAEAKAELVRGAESSTPLVRAHALELMREASFAGAGPYVMRGLDDDAPVVRFAAAMAAGELRVADAREKLRKLALEDKDTSIQIAARFALHKLGDTSLSHDLEITARSDDPRTRGDTAMVLGLLNEKSALNILRAMRNDPDVSVRLQVAEAMWRLGDRDALTPLVGGTVSQFPDDQMTALMGLASAGDRRVIEHLRGALTSDYDAISLVAARAMGKLGSDEGLGVALKGAKSTDPKLRLLAALAMGDIRRSDSQDQLQTLLRDQNADVRLAAASALLKLK